MTFNADTWTFILGVIVMYPRFVYGDNDVQKHFFFSVVTRESFRNTLHFAQIRFSFIIYRYVKISIKLQSIPCRLSTYNRIPPTVRSMYTPFFFFFFF